jgi:Uma2 family endonuclease
MNLEQWAALPDDALGELVDGRLVEEEVPDWIHEEVITWLASVLRPWVRGRGGRIGGSGARIAVGDERGRRPDLVVFLRDKPPARGLITVVPDIVIEVVSASPEDQRRDRVEKVAEYAARGIAQYWLVDPSLTSFEVLMLADSGRYEHTVAATRGRLEDLPGCPGLSLDLDELWRELAELDQP